jgi:mannose-6-phosphate isomerase-like protein (cupin superfamily)
MNIDKNLVLTIIAVVAAFALSTIGDRPKRYSESVPHAAARASAVAQQPAAQNAAPAMETYTSAGDVQALIAQKKAAPLLAAAPYNVNMEYRATIGPAAVHEREAEIFYIIEGTGTMVTGGKLVNETHTNPTNLSGTGIEGGSSRTVSKGDFILVPEGTPHWFSAIGGNGVLVDMSIHVPRPVPSFAELEKLVPTSQ